jgi:glutamate dehydrogenase (NADP+)
VAQYAVEKAMALGAKVVTVSDSSGTVVDEDGFTPEKLAELMEVKNHHYGRVSDYAARGRAVRGRQAPLARAGGRGPALRHAERARRAPTRAPWSSQRRVCVAEGANMPSTIEAAKAFEGRRAVRTGQGQQRRRRGHLGPGDEPERHAPVLDARRGRRPPARHHAGHPRRLRAHGKRADGRVSYVS